MFPIRLTVFEYERGLKYVKGRFKQVVGPGQYWLWAFGQTTIRKIDMRPQYLSVPGQAVLTADGVGLKVSLTAVYNISDPAMAINQVSDYRQGLYMTVQTSLRQVISTVAMDDLLGNTGLNQRLLEASMDGVAALGLQLTSVSIKDLMLPGELRKLYAQIVQARQEGLAQLERARGETAALRSLANAARLTTKNPALMTLRVLQAIEQSTGNTFHLDLSMTNDGEDGPTEDAGGK
ncbi:slipin family protein [Leptothoe spongobia]|uniref:Slipin family protein n=1 Tax=Leptothoe spongobia TAU-MAC 1115 TaxID=1967444 RepID=A0A947GK77_9CYAN|nr:slipin family protein [Leptothoe spongobia]MBT9316077.1 slipin family protein [Leptothoe spongobia TAU-MAC 1115]